MFVILGSMRSGTTLLAQCLNAHSALVVPDETDFVIPTAFIVDRVADEQVGKRLAGDLIVNSKRFGASLGRYLDEATMREALAGARYDATGMISAIYDAVAKRAGVAQAGDKSPNDMQYVRVLLDDGFFDTVKALHIVRDVRDVVVSMHRLGWIPRLRFGYPRFWSADNILVANRLSVVPEHYHRLRYEDLVTDPEGVLAEACAFLGVEFEMAMVDDQRRRDASHHPQMFHHERTFMPIDGTGIGSGREAFDDEALAHVERLGAEGLARFGYLGDHPS